MASLECRDCGETFCRNHYHGHECDQPAEEMEDDVEGRSSSNTSTHPAVLGYALAGLVGLVGLGRFELPAAFIVEPQHQLLVSGKRLGRGHIVDTVLFPQTAVVTESGEAALGADASACQYNDVILHQSKILPGFMIPFGSNTCFIPLR